MARILLAGAPRSGTSWTGGALARCAGVAYADEPDGFREAFPFRVMMALGENPRLAPGAAAADYERLWSGVFAGGRPARGPVARLAEAAYRRAGTDARRRARAGDGTVPLLRIAAALARPPGPDPAARHVVAKSVQCARSIEWIADRFAPTVVVLARDPRNAIASWRDLGFVRNPRETSSLAADARDRWGVEAPAASEPALAHQAFVYAVTAGALADAARRHPDWIVVRHEDLCVEAGVALADLAGRLGLDWTPAAAAFVADSDRAGTGFDTARVAALQPERWRERLSDDEVAIVEATLDRFPAGLLGGR